MQVMMISCKASSSIRWLWGVSASLRSAIIKSVLDLTPLHRIRFAGEVRQIATPLRTLGLILHVQRQSGFLTNVPTQ